MFLLVELGAFHWPWQLGRQSVTPSTSRGHMGQLLQTENSESVALVWGLTQLVHNVKATTEVSLLVIIFDIRITPVQIQKENQSYSSIVIIHLSLPKSNCCRQCNFCMDWDSFGGFGLFCTTYLLFFWTGYNNDLAKPKQSQIESNNNKKKFNCLLCLLVLLCFIYLF